MRDLRRGTLAGEDDVAAQAPAVDRATIVRLAAEDFVDNILAGEAENLAILNEVLAERKPAKARARKSS